MRRGRRGGLSFYQRKKKISNERVAEIMSWVFVVLLGFLLSFFTIYTVGVKTTVMGGSMETGLHNGQVVYMNRIIYSFKAPARGDVVVFKPNGNDNAHYSIKRVVAVPGDKIYIYEGVLYLNGEAQEDMFIDKIADAGIASEEITLKADEFFLMGDNVNNSEDSRSPNLGLVMRNHIVGQAWLHLASGNEGMGRVK